MQARSPRLDYLGLHTLAAIAKQGGPSVALALLSGGALDVVFTALDVTVAFTHATIASTGASQLVCLFSNLCTVYCAFDILCARVLACVQLEGDPLERAFACLQLLRDAAYSEPVLRGLLSSVSEWVHFPPRGISWCCYFFLSLPKLSTASLHRWPWSK